MIEKFIDLLFAIIISCISIVVIIMLVLLISYLISLV